MKHDEQQFYKTGAEVLRKGESVRAYAFRTGISAATANRCAQAVLVCQRLGLKAFPPGVGLVKLATLSRVRSVAKLRMLLKRAASGTVEDIKIAAKRAPACGSRDGRVDGYHRGGRTPIDPVIAAKRAVHRAKAQLAAARLAAA